ncbi:unnamed protein product, partial [Discosporangium mesarthrocarpum]
RANGLKFQGVVLPNGLLCDLCRPIAGSRHDAHILGRRNLNPKVANMQEGAPAQHAVYGDTACPNLFHVKRGYWRTPGQVASNRAMSVARISIDERFGKLVQQFPFSDYNKNLNLHLQHLQSYILRQLSLSTCKPACMAVRQAGVLSRT